MLLKELLKRVFDPIKAIQMVTLNVAEYYRVSDIVGGIAPGRYADIVLLDSLSRIEPKLVASILIQTLKEIERKLKMLKGKVWFILWPL